jgi:5-methylcytosine-specific restriction protein A
VPRRAPRPCPVWPCKGMQPCPRHPPERSPQASSTARGYGSDWAKASRQFILEHPVCVMCGGPAEVTDHITPHKGDAALFWDRSNWQPLCRSDHSHVTVKFDGGWGKPVRPKPVVARPRSKA